MPKTEKELRWEIFRALLPYYGKIVTPNFLRRTSQFIPGIDRVHPLIEGIYKPKWSDHSLSIASMKQNPCADKLTYLPDGRWIIKYSAKKGGPAIAANGKLPKRKRTDYCFRANFKQDSQAGISISSDGFGTY